jgi:hypothetical protein
MQERPDPDMVLAPDPCFTRESAKRALHLGVVEGDFPPSPNIDYTLEQVLPWVFSAVLHSTDRSHVPGYTEPNEALEKGISSYDKAVEGLKDMNEELYFYTPKHRVAVRGRPTLSS